MAQHTTEEQFDMLLTLSGMRVQEQERVGLMEDMDQILQYIEQLQALDLTEEGSVRSLQDVAGCRADEVMACETASQTLVRENFPQASEDGLLEAQAALPTGAL